MRSQFLKDHLVDFEIIAALGIAALLRYGFGFSWFFAIPAGLSAFILTPILLLLAFQVHAIWMMRKNR